MTQKVQEGLLWEEIEKEKAKQRQSCGQGGVLLMDTVPQANKGAVRDIIAKKVDVGSGRTYDR